MTGILHRKNRERGILTVRTRAALLAAALTLCLVTPAWAAAFSARAPKQEVVYIRLNADGSVREISVVNIFELDAAGQIVDYGDYTALRNMTTTDAIAFQDQTVRIDTSAGKLYYEGTLADDIIPWRFSMHYYMDGEEYPAEALSGKSGAFKLMVTIRQDPDCRSTFFENYALQASFTLDTALCKNIMAEGATAANVGADRQLTYTILPGTEKDIVITADVRDFQMDGIAINGLPLHMDVTVDTENNEALGSELTDLENAVTELDEGAGELEEGAAALEDGAFALRDGVTELYDGADALAQGAAEVREGTGALCGGALELDSGARDLVSGAAKLHEGGAQLQKGAGELESGTQKAVDGAAKLCAGTDKLLTGAEGANTGAAKLYNGLNTLSSQSATLRGGAYATFVQLIDAAEAQLNARLGAAGLSPVELTPENYGAVLTELLQRLAGGAVPSDGAAGEAAAGLNTLYQAVLAMKGQLDDYNTFYTGLCGYTEGVDDAANGAHTLYEGTGTLKTGVAELKSGASALYAALLALHSGSAELLSGTVTLNNGVMELHNGTIKLKNGTTELVDGVVELKNGTVKLYDGAVELRDGEIELLDGVLALHDGTLTLHDGTVELKEGTLEFRDRTADLDTQLKDKLNNAIHDMLGGDIDVVSFVSERNTNVGSVQFVISTDAIGGAAEPTVEMLQAETPSFWERLLGLFRIG